VIAPRRVLARAGRRPLAAWPAGAIVALALLGPAGVRAAGPDAPTVTAWDRDVARVEARLAAAAVPAAPFLLLDLQGAESRLRDLRALIAGAVLVARAGLPAGVEDGERVPGGLVHHWRGAMLVRGMALEDAARELQDPPGGRHQQVDVLDSRVLRREGDATRVYLKLVRRELVTVYYATEHEVRSHRLGPDRALIRSVATRIAELEHVGTPRERERPPARDRGFLWRLNAYWRLQAVPSGVVVELESVSLSRDVPAFVAPLADPLVDRIARESIVRTLEATRARLAAPRPILSPGGPP